MAKDTGIIFLDVSRSVNEKIKTKPPIKLMSLFFIGLMVFTAFSMVTFITQPANASPPATGDKSFLNTSFRTNYADVQSGSSSSYPITFSEQSSVKIYGHVKDSNNITANSTVLNQTINPAAVPSSLSSNDSYIHPMTVYYHAYFIESGLPSGTSWSVTYNSIVYSSTTTTIEITLTTSGTYSYSIPFADSGSYSYPPYPSSGTLSDTGTLDVGFGANTSAKETTTDANLKDWLYSTAYHTK